MIPETVISNIADYSVSFATLVFMIYFMYIFFKHERNDRRDKDKQQNEVEKEFREYLIRQGQEHHRIIEKNTEAYEKLIDVLKYIMQQNSSGGMPN